MKKLYVLGKVFSIAVCISMVTSCASSIKTPSKKNASSPEKVIGYFVEAWGDGDYGRMFGALSRSQQDSIDFDAWLENCRDDLKHYGLPVSHQISGPLNDTGHKSLWKVDMTFSNSRVGTLSKQTWVVQEEAGWRIGKGGLGPAKTLFAF